MEAREARKAFEAGQLPAEQLLDMLQRQERLIQRLHTEMQRLKQRLAQYEPEILQEPAGPEPDQQPPSASYSLDAEEKRRQPHKRRKKSPGRRPTELKFAQAQTFEDVYPNGVPRDDYQLLRQRAVWRLRDNRAVLVGYRIYGPPGGPEPPIPGVTPRCEYGLEILVVLAFLVYIIGVSQDKACAVLVFFCQLPLSRSQADALLRQLAQHWHGEFDTLCDLLAHAAVVYMDETGWKVGTEGCSLWTFASATLRVFVFGCHKDAATLDTILPPEVFHGIGVSDDAAVYRHRFERAQKCWAHLLRKAIRLALLYPHQKKYQRFLDELLALYRDAKRVSADGRLGPAGRQDRVTDLENRLMELCLPYQGATSASMPPQERDFVNLVNELLERLLDGELFTFVLHPEVEPTNNFTERLQRHPAQERKAGRTSKTAAGAERRSVIVSVLESLRANLPVFTLSSVLEEVQRWLAEGTSLFARQWQALVAVALAAAVPDTS
jgi:transposase